MRNSQCYSIIMSDIVDQEHRLALSIGFATQLIILSDRRMLSSISVYHFLSSPARLGQLAFLFRPWGKPISYVAWAFVTDEVLNLLAVDPDRPLTTAEWNEGTNLIVMDVVAPAGGVYFLRKTLEEACPHSATVHWIARRRTQRDAILKRCKLGNRDDYRK